MGIFDDLGATVSSLESSVISSAQGLVTNATNAVNSITAKLSSGLPSLGSLLGGAGGGATPGVVDSGVKLPLPNPLFSYASYNCILSLGMLTADQLNNPDTTYRAGKSYALICKSGSMEPSNRVNTPYGKFEFYIDDLELEGLIGHEAGMNTNVTSLKFRIIEPYSMGMFFLACQQAALEQRHQNWNEAPFIIGIEFKGNTETGTMESVPNTSRYIPIHFGNIDMTVNEDGAIYNVTANTFDQAAITDAYAKFKGDVAASGATVQEMLQTGEKSLETVMNRKFKEIADKITTNKDSPIIPDQIAIVFPSVTATSTTPAASKESTDSSAPDTPTLPSDNSAISADILKKLGVTQSTVTSYLVQDPKDCNAIGRAKMGFDQDRKADAPVGKDNVVYNDKTKINNQQKNSVKQDQSDMKFRQDTDIINAINQVILQSKFIEDTFDASKLSPEGYRGWWTVDKHVYINGPVQKATGESPKLMVYRVLPYGVHNSSGPTSPNVEPYGYDQLIKQAVKVYNYIYTGKNVDVLKFEIRYNPTFVNVLAADGNSGTQSNVNQAAAGGVNKEPNTESAPLPDGKLPSTKADGPVPTVTKYIATQTGTDKLGGATNETQAVRAARIFHDAVTGYNGTDMQTLDLEIIGDPYWIAQSGMGNYCSEQTEHANLNADGSVDYQSGEVDIVVNFRTPLDLNQNTGLFDFSAGSAPINNFSGLYRITQVHSTFKEGSFKQKLVGIRRKGQDPTQKPTADTVYTTKKEVVNPKDPNLSEEESGT
jgi:hypothetical protein